MTARGPLEGIRVIDLGTVIAGPFAATLLADFGADVIKVEIPGRGDTLRQLGPIAPSGTSYWWAADARNKKSVTLDLRQSEAQALFLKLVDVSDVVVENFIPGTLAKWGLGADVLAARNPRLVVSHASGYGQTGPYAQRPGYDRVGVAFAGLWHMTGEADREPIRPGLSLADYLTGTLGALGIMMALFHRDARGGAGQEVDAALYESVFRTMEYTVSHYSLTGEIRGRSGNAGPAVPSGAFMSADGRWLAMTVAQDAMYGRLMRAIGRDDFAEAPHYRGAPGRMADREPIERAIRDWIGSRTAAEVERLLMAAEIPIAVEATVADTFVDPQFAHREVIQWVDDPALGRTAIQGVTPKLSATPGGVHSPAPLLGQHNDEVYGGLLGLTSPEVEGLRARGVI